MGSIFSVLLVGAAVAEYSVSNEWRQDIHRDFETMDHKPAFEDWKLTFEKTYGDLTEESHRYMVFLENWKMVNDHNMASFNWTMGLNQFSDFTVEEFQYQIHGHLNSCRKQRDDSEPREELIGEVRLNPEAPTSVDWTDVGGKSYVTPVKNQGQCGSCWAFSTTGSLESRAAIASGTTGSSIISLSEQQLVDCSRAEGNAGCNGGLQEDAFKYIGKEGGLCNEAEYPYTGRDGSCKATSCGQKYDKIQAANPYTKVTVDSETALVNAIADGPVAVSVDAAGNGWQHYKSGVYSDQCGVLLDHGVTGVGYGTATQGGDYWKIKNSWGKTWGMEGYILICRNCNKNGNMGECGVLRDNTYPNF